MLGDRSLDRNVNVRGGSMQRVEHKNKIEGIDHRTGM
jgi:hypothetical protein